MSRVRNSVTLCALKSHKGFVADVAPSARLAVKESLEETVTVPGKAIRRIGDD